MFTVYRGGSDVIEVESQETETGGDGADQLLAQHGPKDDGAVPPLPNRASRPAKNGLGFDAHSHLFRLTGVDLTEIP
jgi:hypothetical protein